MISLPGRELKDSLSFYGHTCSSMPIVALFTRGRKLNQPRCLSTNEPLRKLKLKMCILDSYSTIKKSGIMRFAEKLMELERNIYKTC